MNHVEMFEYAFEQHDYAEAARIAFENAKRKASRSGRSYWLGEVRMCLNLLGIPSMEFDDKIRFADKYGNFAPLGEFLKTI
jgi:hypothetical protein